VVLRFTLREKDDQRRYQEMSCVRAKDIMHPRMSLSLKDKGPELLKKLTCEYPALPVVNEQLKVVGIVSEYEILDALLQGRTIHEFSAESIMSCGHAEHEGVCAEPICVSPDTPVEDVVSLMYEQNISILPVVEDGRLVGVLPRKAIVNALAEPGMWPEHEFKKRV
jgi:CBS domain-containing protein